MHSHKSTLDEAEKTLGQYTGQIKAELDLEALSSDSSDVIWNITYGDNTFSYPSEEAPMWFAQLFSAFTSALSSGSDTNQERFIETIAESYPGTAELAGAIAQIVASLPDDMSE